MLLNKALHANLGVDVYNYLSKIETLPKSGFIAGQSITSALLHLHGTGNTGPINDIDIYELDKKKHPRSLAMSFYPEQYRIGYHSRPENAPDRNMEHSNDYTGVEFFSVKKATLFNITDVKYNGLLNLIKVTNFSSDFKVTPFQILESFDLNMVKVGLDISTKKLCWTSDFEFFIKTGQLEIVNAHSMFHTACRLEKKKSEMPWLYTNNELNIQTLLLPKIISKTESKDPNTLIDTEGLPIIRTGNTFGKKYKDIFDKSSTLQELFSITTRKNKNIYTFDIIPQYLTNLDKQYVASCRDLINSNFQKVNMVQAAHALAPTLAKNYLLKKGKHFADALNELKDQKECTKKQIAVYGASYLKGQVQSEWASRIERLLKKHGGLSYLFIGVSLTEQSTLYTNLKKLEDQFGEYIYGLFETKSFTSSDILDYAHIEKQIKKYHTKQSEPFKNFKSLPSYVYDGVAINDLKSRLEIMAEGMEMRHCVGGYASSVADNHCRILSLRCSEHKSTAELRKAPSRILQKLNLLEETEFNSSVLRVVQHRCFANGEPIKKHQDALASYLLNHNKKIYEPALQSMKLDEKIMQALNALKNITFNIPKNGVMTSLSINILNELDLLQSAIDEEHLDSLPVAGFKIYAESQIIDTVIIIKDSNVYYCKYNGMYRFESLKDIIRKKQSCNYSIAAELLQIVYNNLTG